MLDTNIDTTPNTWRNRLRELMINRGFSQADLAPVFGVSRASVSHYMTGRNEPTIYQIADVARHFDVSLDFLLSGGMRDNIIVPKISWNQIQRYLKGGNGESAFSRQHCVPCPVQTCSQQTFAVEVQGDVMMTQSGYEHGDLIFLDPDVAAAHGCDVIARLTDQRLLFRRLSVHEDGTMYLRSLNQGLPVDVVSFDMVAEICAVTIFSGRFRLPTATPGHDWSSRSERRLENTTSEPGPPA